MYLNNLGVLFTTLVDTAVSEEKLIDYRGVISGGWGARPAVVLVRSHRPKRKKLHY